ncbi:PAS domain S-box protein [filamentous cyanobacterium LEGE 11480]|uniref:histidine kinase n=1 Tax=Romeriopsis navalis LEGE 11480 TaxID=2777977 RepID=A0A928Z0N0_9CYAN|nr:PAS domain S-box protein [Romeriopsis navalis]MBE9028441.1 PAS domain S-box protein [Romeriopsis navalis LEGE 11480]
MSDQDWIQLQHRNAALEQQVQKLQAALAQHSPANAQSTTNSASTAKQRLSTPSDPATEPQPASPNAAQNKTLLQRAIIALQRSEARYKNLLQHHPDPIARCMSDGTITAANVAFAHAFGQFEQPVVGDSLWDLAQSDLDLREQFQHGIEELHQASASRRAVQFEHRLVRAGSLHWQHWILTGIYNRHSQLLEIQLIAQNISDRKHLDQTVVRQPDLAEEILQLTERNQALNLELNRRHQLQVNLQRSEARHRSIVATLHEGVLVVNPVGKVQTCNASAAQTMGLTVPELARSSLFDTRWQWLHENGMALEMVDHPAQLTLRTGIPCINVIVGLHRPNNMRLWLAVNAQPMFREGEMLPYEVVLTLSDITQRRQAEADRQALRRRERGAQSKVALAQEQIEQILESVTDSFIACDRHWRFTYVNHEAARTIGRSGKSLLGKVLWEEFPEFAHSSIATFLKQSVRKVQTSEAVEYYAPCDRWYSLRINPSADGIAIYFRDMTDMFKHVYERNQVEADLQESQERLPQLTENIPHVFWMYDLQEQRIIYISRACKTVLGVAPERAQQKNWNEWLTRVHPDDLAAVHKASKRPFGGRSGEITYRFMRPDGVTQWLLGRAFPVRNAEGKVYRIAGMVEDISDRQQKENWLTLLESVILNANDAVLITEAEPVELPGPHIVFVNDAFTKMMGYSREEVIGKTPRILQGPKTDLTKLKSVRAALKRWEPVMVEIINYRKDGSEVWIELSLFPVAGTRGHYNYWVGIQRDVTQRKRAESDLEKTLLKERELSELKSRFVSTTSHEFRTPLSTILSSVDLLEYYAERCIESADLSRYFEHTKRIQNAALNMNNLLNDILVIEKAEANRWQVDPVELDLREFFQHLIDEMLFNDQDQHHLAFQIQRSDGVLDQKATIKAFLDERLLRQIFNNLLSNALKYSPVDSTVNVHLHCSSEQIIVKIRDQGIGVPIADQTRLFEPFHRGTNVGAISGTGLGLAIVKHSVELHQGSIKIQSAANQGTIITVILPRQFVLDHPPSVNSETSVE